MSQSMRPPVITVMEKAVLKAAYGLVRDFGEIDHLKTAPLASLEKFVLVAEKRIETILCDILYQYAPGHNFLIEGSELKENGDPDAPLWIIDPLDGTKNFAHGIPYFAISLALKEGNQLTAALTYDPLHNELFWACRNGGTFLNQMRLRVSPPLMPKIIALGGPHVLNHIPTALGMAGGIRLCGATSLDLAYVAAGRYQGFIGYATHPWDVAAGALLIKEAGGFVSDHAKGTAFLETGHIMAGNEHTYELMLQLMTSALP